MSLTIATMCIQQQLKPSYDADEVQIHISRDDYKEYEYFKQGQVWTNAKDKQY